MIPRPRRSPRTGASRWRRRSQLPTANAVLAGSRDLDQAVCARLHHAAELSSDATLKILAQAGELQLQAGQLAVDLAAVRERSDAVQARLAQQTAALRGLAARADVSPALAESLAAIAAALGRTGTEFAALHEATAAIGSEHAGRLDAETVPLLEAGQMQDIFKQIIDRASPALDSRRDVVEGLVRTLSVGGDAAPIARRAASLVGEYEAAESAHRDPASDAGDGVEFF